VDKEPRLLSIKELLGHFVEHRKEVIVRRTRFDLDKAEARAHILEGLKTALDHIDAVVSVIRSSKTPVEARGRLVSQFELRPRPKPSWKCDFSA